MTSKPKGIILLIAIMIWSLVQGLGKLLAYQDSVDFRLFDYQGLGQIFFVVFIPILVLDFLTLRFLYRPARVGYWFALIGLAMSTVYSFTVAFMSLEHPEIVKEAYLGIYKAYGLKLSGETLAKLNLEALLDGIHVSMAFSTAYLVAMTLLIFAYKPYFYGDSPQEDAT